MNFFPSRWPIMCAVMNGVSDLNLALAVHAAGAMPSLMITGADKDQQIDAALNEFKHCTGHANIVLQISYDDLINSSIPRLLRQYRVSHVELFGTLNSLGMTTVGEFDHMQHDPLIAKGIQFINSISKIIMRVLTPSDTSPIDAYAVKGHDGAGFGGKLSTSDLFDQQKHRTPSMPLIAYGGIGCPGAVTDYIRRGAAAVAVGTMFAATKESCVAETTKQHMVGSSADSLTKFASSQQALVLGDVSEDHTPNHQMSLDQGIAGQGGLVYAGTAIDHVTKIRTVQEVVDYLTSEL